MSTTVQIESSLGVVMHPAMGISWRNNPLGCGVYVSATPPPPAECGPSCNSLGDPINPANGGMHSAEVDIPTRVGLLTFKRFYNSVDQNDSSGRLSPGWRHSFARSIVPKKSSSNYQPYVVSADNSSLYSTEASACTSGFAEIKARVASWASASASYSNGQCRLTVGTTLIGTLPILYQSPPTPPPGTTSAIGFDAIRDDGQVVGFMLDGTAIVAPASSKLKLQQTASGFSLVDEEDNTELYDTAGRLLAITSRGGMVVSVGYDGSQRLSAASSNFGHTITLGYNASGQLQSVTAPDLRTVQYGYDAQGRLESATDTAGATRHYVYENASFPNALTGLVDENQQRHSTWGYDSSGRAESTTEAGGAGAVTLTYNADRTVTATDALGAVRNFSFARYGDRNLVAGISGSQCPTCREPKASEYDQAGFVISRTDYNDHITHYTNDDARGLELSRTEAFGTPRTRTIATQWHPTLRLPTQIDEPGKRTTFTHDANGNVLTKTVLDTTTSESRTWTYTYNTFGQVLTVNGPRTDVSDVTTYTYYSCATGSQCGQVHTITNALGHVTTYNTYNANGQPLTITDPNGIVTTLTYDFRQRLTSRTVGSEQTTFDYWPTGLLKKATLPDGSFLEYAYDDAHRLTEIEDSESNRIVYTLDAMGNRTAEQLYDPSNALTRTRTRIFNTLSQLWKEIGAAGTAAVTTAFAYDNNGNQTNINAPLSRNTVQAYDELNRMTQVTDPLAGVTQYGYNALDQLISVTDPRSKVTSYTYNALGDVMQQVSPDTGTTINTYDSGGNLKTSKDARNKTATYSYDALDRATQVAYGDQTIAYGYDTGTNAIGRLTSASDSSHSLSFSYDPQGRVLSKTQVTGSLTRTASYGYTDGNLTSLTTPSGQLMTYGYTDGRLTSISVNGASLLTNVVYEPFGPVRQWTWGNGTLAVRTSDQDGKVTQIDSAGLKTYAYDDAFRITGIIDAVDSTLSWSYGYDGLGRLTSALKTGSTFGYSYDANGNRLTQSGTSASTYTIASSSNRVSSITGSLARTYTYDAAGNTLTDGTRTLTYNNRGRMKSLNNGTFATNYTYNALGQLIKKSNVNITQHYYYDEAGHLIGEYFVNGGMIQETVWLGDIPVATLRPKTGGVDIFYVHTDHLNTPRKITRPSDNKLRWRWDPDAFGNGAPNENPQALGVFKYSLRLPGQVYLDESGLHYNYFRDYDPQTGRYPESDPAGLLGGINTYAYVDGNPIWFIDPNGLGKEGGRRGIGGDDPLIPKDINKNTPRAIVDEQIKKIDDEIKRLPNMKKERIRKLRAWQKVARRGFTKVVCPPFLEDIVLELSREQCLAGDPLACQTYLDLGGEVDPGGT